MSLPTLPRTSAPTSIEPKPSHAVVRELCQTVAPPVGGWRRVLADSFLVGGATLIGQALGVVTSLLLRFLLTPAQTGIWQGLKLALSYGNYSGLGVSKAAAREVSLASGRDATDATGRTINLAFTVNTLTSLSYALVIVGVAVWIGWRGGELATDWMFGLIAVASLTMMQRYVTFRVTLLRADQQFRATAIISLQEAVTTLAATAVCVWLWGLTGLYIATALVMLVTWAYLIRRGEHAFRLAWNTPEIRRLMKIGGPLLAAGVVSSLFRSLDRLMLLASAADGEFQLGCYSTALLVATQLYGLANILAGVFGPRLTQAYGLSEDSRSVARLTARLTELQAIALALPAALSISVAPFLLRRFLPEYAPGLPALAPMVWGTLATGLALPAQHCLVAWNRGRGALAALTAGAVLALVANGIAIACGGGLWRIAIATAAANAGYFALMIWMTMRNIPSAELRRRAWAGTASLIPLLFASGLAAWVPAGTGSSATLTGAACCLVWLVVVALGWRAFGWREFVHRGATSTATELT